MKPGNRAEDKILRTRKMRCLEVAAAGSDYVIMIGPPNSGKTMLARRLPTILPDMNFEESLETTKIFRKSFLTTCQ